MIDKINFDDLYFATEYFEVVFNARKLLKLDNSHYVRILTKLYKKLGHYRKLRALRRKH